MITLNASPAVTREDLHFGRIASFLLGVGAVGLVMTCAFYALAGPQAALPGGWSTVEAARASTPGAWQWMRLAGLVGMPSDVMLGVGALMMAMTKRGSGAGVAVAGWLSMAIAGALFIIIDAMVAFVLPPAAAAGDGYLAVRALFDVLFAIGAWATAVGALAAAWSKRWPEFRSWPSLWLMRGAGVIGVFATTGFLLGVPVAPLIGPGIGLLALALVAVGLTGFRASAAGAEPAVPAM